MWWKSMAVSLFQSTKALLKSCFPCYTLLSTFEWFDDGKNPSECNKISQDEHGFLWRKFYMYLLSKMVASLFPKQHNFSKHYTIAYCIQTNFGRDLWRNTSYGTLSKTTHSVHWVWSRSAQRHWQAWSKMGEHYPSWHCPSPHQPSLHQQPPHLSQSCSPTLICQIWTLTQLFSALYKFSQ